MTTHPLITPTASEWETKAREADASAAKYERRAAGQRKWAAAFRDQIAVEQVSA